MSVNVQRRSPTVRTPSFSEQIPVVLQRIYLNRDLAGDDDISLALKDLHPPDGLLGLANAVDLLATCVEEQQKILVVGDFDADGATSCAVALRALKSFGHDNVSFLVPNRFDFGYGLTAEIVDFALRQSGEKPALIVTVDNGISSVEGVARAQAAGVKVLVTDHHLPGDELPQADAIVNPNQPECEFPSKNLAGVGVIFYVMASLRSHLTVNGWFERQAIQPPKMTAFLDLVALGTVADLVPLDRNNRILVENGLRRIRQGMACEGINALIAIAQRSSARLVAADFGFALAPRINAAGRLDDISLGIAMLLTNDADLAHEMASELDGLNRDRRQIEAGMKQEAERSIAQLFQNEDEGGIAELPVGVCLFDENWHQGVVGILASRIKERYHRPTICFALASDKEDEQWLKGSARSIKGLHMRDALDLVYKRHSGLIEKFGGHAMAAGLSVHRDNYAAFSQAFDEVVAELIDEQDLQAVLLTDGDLPAEEMILSNAELIRHAQPWGQKLPEPMFDGEFRLVHQKIVGENHLKCRLVKIDNAEQVYDGIAFNIERAEWPNPQVERVRVAYSLDVNEFRGMRSVQLLIRHIQVL